MRSSASSLSGLSLILPYDWYSGGRVFDPRYIFRRDLVMRKFLRPFPMASLSRTVVTYWRKYGHSVLDTA